MIALKCENVYKVFGKDADKATRMLQQGASPEELPEGSIVAVNNVSLEIKAGEIFVVMGLSGSGKSTLLRTLNALGPATGGKIWVDGEEITAANDEEIRRIRAEKMAMVFQHFGLLPHRTVIENAAYPLEIRGIDKAEREERALESLKTCNLLGWENKYPDQLSGGMQQRVGIARALTADSPILLMDEAFSALDPLIRREMQELLLEIQDQKRRTIVFITHDLNEAMYLGDRIAVMRHGKVDQIGTAEEILTNPANEYIEKFISDVDRSRVITAGSVMVPPPVRLYTTDGPNLVLRKLSSVDDEAGWVVNPGSRRLAGLLYSKDIIAAMRGPEPPRTVRDLVRTDYMAASPETPVAELVTALAETAIRVPVVDEHERLLGVVPRIQILRALSDRDDFEDETIEPAQPAADEIQAVPDTVPYPAESADATEVLAGRRARREAARTSAEFHEPLETPSETILRKGRRQGVASGPLGSATGALMEKAAKKENRRRTRDSFEGKEDRN
ncbi:glycine betaine ABC transporter ATP-binding protein [Actinobaculum suis]|uniref:Glycine betaine ABC transporter ATP-binding protein n=2 Tax=Actinobaculum suis TaxID=1657 RepID=A0A1B9BEV5_9ACTO|nr:hypothetical protein ACU21_02215 [Actinobaculum suis]VDG76211.1 glycine betaine ABC transporter ATP-binding protein [Actinobaculum suis]